MTYERYSFKEDDGKYSDSGVNDPILRCIGCRKLVHRQFIHTNGMCNHCGMLRFTPVLMFSEEEAESVLDGSYKFEIGEYTIDPEFIALFAPTGEGVNNE